MTQHQHQALQPQSRKICRRDYRGRISTTWMIRIIRHHRVLRSAVRHYRRSLIDWGCCRPSRTLSMGKKSYPTILVLPRDCASAWGACAVWLCVNSVSVFFIRNCERSKEIIASLFFFLFYLKITIFFLLFRIGLDPDDMGGNGCSCFLQHGGLAGGSTDQRAANDEEGLGDRSVHGAEND